MEYPKTIYVQRINEDIPDESYLSAEEEAGDVADGAVAIYELKKIVNKRTKTIIEDK